MVSGSIIAPLVNGGREVRKMEKLQERNEFLYKTKALLPYKRKEMIVDMLEKSRALMEQDGFRNNRSGLLKHQQKLHWNRA